MILSSLANITLKPFQNTTTSQDTTSSTTSTSTTTANTEDRTKIIHSNAQTKLNEFFSSATSKLKSTFNFASSSFNYSKPHIVDYNNKNMFFSKNHLSSAVASNSLNKSSNKTPSKYIGNSGTNDSIKNSTKFKDGKIVKRTKTDKFKNRFTNTNLLHCFNLAEKERFRELLAQNVPVQFKNTNASSGGQQLFQASDSSNLYQNYIRFSPTKTRDDNSAMFADRKLKNISTTNEYLIDSTLPTSQTIASTSSKISAGYSRRISLAVDFNKQSTSTTTAAPSILQSTLLPNISSNNKYNQKNISCIELDKTPATNRIIPSTTNLSSVKVAKKRQNNQCELVELDQEDDDDIIEIASIQNDSKSKTHNQILSSNYSLISKHSKLNVNNKTYQQNEKNWNERLNKNTPILQEILFKSQMKSNALAIEEERYKFKKRQRLEREKIERELAQKFSQQLHLDANNLALLKDEDVIEIIEEDEFPELNEEQESLINQALIPSPQDEVLVEGFSVKLTRRDIQTLRGLNWLNDEIINFYMTLICERSKQSSNNENLNDSTFLKAHAFSTFFYPKLLKDGYSSLKRWTRKIDLFSYDIILIPVHLGLHWTLAVIDMTCKEVRYYDSMNGNNHECLRSLRNYLRDEYADKKNGAQLNLTEWNCLHVKDVPQQMNGSDCGMFTCKYAEYISRGKTEFNFNQSHMPYYRRRMIWEILHKKLM